MTAALSSCQLEQEEISIPSYGALPAGFPKMPVPEDNIPNTARVSLGKRLFFDPILSRDSSISCSSCHFQEKAFSDYPALSIGIEGREGFRNAPPLFNLAWHPYFFFDGGVPTLEQQILAPIDAHFEMDNNILNVIKKLEEDRSYPDQFRVAYGRNPDPYSITRAIAAFERTMVSGSSPYDKFINGIDAQALNESQIRGMNLFFGDQLNCSKCHSGFNFTNYEFENIGLPVMTADSGRMRVTLDENDRNKYKTPSLRNIALTGPYMHDGSIETLSELVDFLASGGMHYPNQNPLSQGFQISNTEKEDLINFLNALTDEQFVSDPAFMK